MKEERDRRRLGEAREVYDRRWVSLLGGGEGRDGRLKFEDIPWPVYEANTRGHTKHKHQPESVSLSVDILTPDAISAFILPSPALPLLNEEEKERNRKARKDKLRETLLRFHPDKFEGRLIGRVVGDGEREKVSEGVGRVVRALNVLMGEG